MSVYRRIAGAVRTLRVDKLVHATTGALSAVRTDDPVFHITYDDGPHPDVTPKVLDVLDEFDASATFFLLTENAQRYPELVADMMARGHEIGLHTRTHPRLPNVGWSRLHDEIVVARRDLEEVAGREVTWFRPPYGAHGVRSIAMVKSQGMKTLLWSVDSRDYKGITGDPVAFSRNEIEKGGILLLHDRPVGASLEEDAARGLMEKQEVTRAYLVELQRLEIEPVPLNVLLGTGAPLKKLKLG